MKWTEELLVQNKVKAKEINVFFCSLHQLIFFWSSFMSVKIYCKSNAYIFVSEDIRRIFRQLHITKVTEFGERSNVGIRRCWINPNSLAPTSSVCSNEYYSRKRVNSQCPKKKKSQPDPIDLFLWCPTSRV